MLILKLKLKLQYFGYLMCRGNSLEKTLMLEKMLGKKAGGEGDLAEPNSRPQLV